MNVEESARALRGFHLTAAMVVTGLVLSALAQLPGANPLRSYRVVWPQHWPFFTELSQDVLVAYNVPDLTPLVPRRPWDGLRREGSVVVAETRRVALRVPDAYWQACGEATAAMCGEEVARSSVFTLDGSTITSRLCGRVAVAVERSVPKRHVHRIAVVEVECGP
ncbi:hypothetical protein [Saccharothrix luteola]|uniref:hypothetical protein n=1 Tax=Saccharothrix luteola TaxID=2893018 RepID=UPI001E3A4DB0|nr:hypothetical protein [Saccharothrix luteola]MCC8251526.1 hypothetical protein [Saccharothrix luteola]